jgi:hypothetical protein
MNDQSSESGPASGYRAGFTLVELLVKPIPFRLSITRACGLAALAFLVFGCGHAQKAPPPPAPLFSKTAVFGAVLSTDPDVTGALSAKNLAGAASRVGQRGSFIGTVSKVYQRGPHTIAILDFAPNYHMAVRAVVQPMHLKDMPKLGPLVGQDVLVTGTWMKYGNFTEIEVDSPVQIRIIVAN